MTANALRPNAQDAASVLSSDILLPEADYIDVADPIMLVIAPLRCREHS
jgi:hypothetical protein